MSTGTLFVWRHFSTTAEQLVPPTVTISGRLCYRSPLQSIVERD